jgi:hypothetical protein
MHEQCLRSILGFVGCQRKLAPIVHGFPTMPVRPPPYNLARCRNGGPVRAVIVICCLGAALAAKAQNEPGRDAVPAAQAESSSESLRDRQMQNMDKMATTVTRMAEMCESMMKVEKANRAWMIGAGVTAFLLVILDLSLLAVLQVLWIKYWHRKSKL